VSFVANVAGVLALAWIVQAGFAGALRATPGSYAVLFQAMHGLVNGLFGVAENVRELTGRAAFAAALRAFFAQPASGRGGPAARANQVPHHAAGTAPAPLRPFPHPMRYGVRFEDVWFTYPGSRHPTLAGVTLEIRAGERVAVVGENGAGKSTLVKLLLGLEPPDAGRVTVDGLDLSALDPRSLRRATSAVFQRFARYPLSLAENVGIGQPELLADGARIERALRMAGAGDVVRTLPRGAETLLGPDVGGVDLSGGQWQRLALARAFFRDAELLVLDEPTAALDPLAELAVFERFLRLAKGKAALLVSHRLGMARLADRVVVFSRGRVVEDGSHAALVAAGREYAALFGAQSRWYV
jgi:ATP-binding cassette subfamily B protein